MIETEISKKIKNERGKKKGEREKEKDDHKMRKKHAKKKNVTGEIETEEK